MTRTTSMTRTTMVALASGLFILAAFAAGGCGWSNAHARGLRLWEEDHPTFRLKNFPFVPSNAVGQCPSPCDEPTEYIEPPFFGYHDTCWRRWPSDWAACPVEPLSEVEGVEPTKAPQTKEPSPSDQTEVGGEKPQPRQPGPEESVIVPAKPKDETATAKPTPPTESKPAPQPKPAPQGKPAPQPKPAPQAKPAPQPKPMVPMPQPPVDPPAEPSAPEKPQADGDTSLPRVPSIFNDQSLRRSPSAEPEVAWLTTPVVRERSTSLVATPVTVAALPHVAFSTSDARRLQRSLRDRMRIDRTTAAASDSQRESTSAGMPAQPLHRRIEVAGIGEDAQPPVGSSIPALLISERESKGAPPLRRVKAKPIRRASTAVHAVAVPKAPPAVVIDAKRLREAKK